MRNMLKKTLLCINGTCVVWKPQNQGEQMEGEYFLPKHEQVVVYHHRNIDFSCVRLQNQKRNGRNL